MKKEMRMAFLLRTLAELADDYSKLWSDYPCLTWPFASRGGTHPYGAISIKVDGKESVRCVHREAWILTHGAIPDGLFVCHHCDSPPCYRPIHLFIGNQSQNILDCSAKGRHNNCATIHPELIARGERHGTAKLTAAQVLEIRRLYKPRVVSVYTLARQFGMSTSEVHRIVRHQIWRSI